MKNSNNNIKLVVNLLISLIILLSVIFVVPRLVIFFMPFVIGWLISCIANPLVVFLEHKIRIKRKIGTVLVIVGSIAAVIGVGYLVITILFRQLYGFIADMPQMWRALLTDLERFANTANQYVGNISPKVSQVFNNLEDIIGDMISGLPSSVDFSGMGSMVGSIANVIIAIIMCVMSAYFFIADREWCGRFFERYIPQAVKKKYDVFYTSIKQAVGGYFKAQLRIELWIYILLLFGLTVLNVRYSAIIALLIAILDFLPVFGSGAVLAPWAVVSLLGGNYVKAVGMVVIWGISQLVRQLIQPKIMGDSIGMEPIPTLFLLFVGYKLAGVGGMLVAVPIGIIVVNMNEAGFFDTPKYSLRILIANINSFRRLNDEDMLVLDEENENDKGGIED